MNIHTLNNSLVNDLDAKFDALCKDWFANNGMVDFYSVFSGLSWVVNEGIEENLGGFLDEAVFDHYEYYKEGQYRDDICQHYQFAWCELNSK